MIIIRRAFTTLYYFIQLLISFQNNSRLRTNALLLEAVQDLGGVYIKFMQFVCLRTELFDNEAKIQFVRLYDQVPPEDLNVHYFLEHELKEKAEELISIEDQPFAAGSFSQVYRAKLKNGTPVIIKVKRKDQHQKVWFDFALLRVIVTVIHWIFDIEQINLIELVKEFRKTTFLELDYFNEVAHAQYFHTEYENDPTVVIPQTFSHLSNNNLIVQEYIEGVPLTKLITYKQESPEEYNRISQSLNLDMRKLIVLIAEELVRQHLFFDKYYGDPHPGNIIVLPNNHFALIDFGILDVIRQDRKEYFSVMKLLSVPIEELDVKGMSQQVLELTAKPLYKALLTLENVSVSKANLAEVVVLEYAGLIDEQKQYFSTAEITKKEDLTRTLLSFTQAGKKFQIHLPQGFFNIMRSTAMFKAYASFLEPDYHFMRDVYRTMIKRCEGVEFKTTTQEKKYTLEEAFEVVFTWLSSVAEVDVPLYFKIEELLSREKYAA